MDCIVHGVAKIWTRLSDFFFLSSGGSAVKNLPEMQKPHDPWSLGQEDPMEEGMASHSSIFAWRIPGTEEAGRLKCIGSQRVGHD